MPWSRHRLRDADVWARVDIQGRPVQDADGRVEVVYKPVEGARVYRAAARNLVATGDAPIEIAVGQPAPDRRAAAAAIPADAIQVWTDGGAQPNPGPCGIGVVIVDGTDRRELSEYLGHGTNNIAELTAIVRGLEALPTRDRPVVVYSDSTYAIGLLSNASWKAKANVELVARLRKLVAEFRDIRFVKVAAHSGIALNERVDQLATSAIARRA